MSDSVQIIVSDSTLGDTISVISQPENTGISVLENSAPIPSGGLTGQALTKNSNTSYDLIWQFITANIADGDKGDIVVTSSGSVWTVDAGAISLSKMAALPTLTLIGNNTGGSATPLALTMAQVKVMLGLTAGDVSGLAAVATSGSASDLTTGTLPAARFDDTAHGTRAGGALHADAVAAGASGFMTGADKTKLDAITGTNTGDQTITLTGPVTGSGTGSFATSITALAITSGMIADDAVGNDKLANVATQTFKGRATAGTGSPEDLTLAQAKTLLGLTGTNSGDQTITLTGDITGSGTGSFAATIANNSVTNAKVADMATATIKGRTTAGTGDPEDLTVAQATALLDVFSSSLKGLAPASGGGTTNFLRADGTWSAPPGGSGGGMTTGLSIALAQNAYIS